ENGRRGRFSAEAASPRSVGQQPNAPGAAGSENDGGYSNMSHFRESRLQIFTCNSNPDLAREIADHIGVPLGDAEVGRFSDGEIYVRLNESVRGSDVYVIQSTCHPVNQHLMELLVMVDALKRASARTINVVIPYYGYARQDRKTRARDPITAKLVANLIET